MILEIIGLGALQGLTEFLPISSSGHLVLVHYFFDLPYDLVSLLFFDVMVHTATTLAVIIYFAKDWFNIFLYNRRLLWYIVIATVPAGLVGFVLVETGVMEKLREPYWIAVFFIFGAAIMQWGEDSYNQKARYALPRQNIDFLTAMQIGLFQVFSLFPGISRSGATIAAGFAAGLNRRLATRFSFLLATPIIVVATGYELYNFVNEYWEFAVSPTPTFIPPLYVIVGMVTAFVFAMLTIKFLLRFLQSNTLDVFIRYKLTIAGFIILYYVIRFAVGLV